MSTFSRLIHCTFCTSHNLSKSSTFIKSLSTDLHEERNLKKLVQKFKTSSQNDRFRTKTGIYFSTIRRLASAKRFRWIEELLEEQKKFKDMNKEGFNVRLISLYGKSRMFDHANKVFDEITERNSEKTVKSFNALLGACVSSKKYEKVGYFFEKLPKEMNVEPDVVSYNILVKAFCEMGEFEKAIGIFGTFWKNGIKPDSISFNTLLDGLYESGRVEEGDKIWEKLVKSEVLPDIRSYNAKIVGLGKGKKMNEAIVLFEELGEKGLKPDVFSYNAMIRGFCNVGDLEEVKKWFGVLEKSKVSADRTTFGIILPFAVEKGDSSWAFELSKEVIERRLLVDGTAMQLVVDGLVKESKIEDAKKLVQLAKTNNYSRYKLKISSE